MKSDSYDMNSVTDIKKGAKKKNCCKSCTDKIIGGLEGGFSRLGFAVASHPLIVIVVSLVVCGLCLIGLLEYYSENRPEKLWVASSSKSLQHFDWYSANYPPEIRICSVIMEKDNVLTSGSLATICDIDESIKGIRINSSDGSDVSWTDICHSPSGNGVCSPLSILQIWQNNCTFIRSLTDGEIIAHLDRFRTMAATRQNAISANISLLLGGITYAQNNPAKIVSAKATKLTYLLKNQAKFDKSKGSRVDDEGTEWEKEFEKLFKNKPTPDSKIVYFSLTSQLEDSGSSIDGDLALLGMGYVLIILYLAVMLGSFSRLDHKVWLAVCGVVCIGLSIGVSYGLSSGFQLFTSPVHSVLPFLLLGIGVDDIFVIIQNWENYGGSTNKDSTIPENIALAMKHAGVSILVTSFTDICAFLIGATTVLPALRSFCIFAGIGIIAVFLLTCTFFVAWLSLDSRRQRSYRDACCCCCVKLDLEWKPLKCSEKNYLQLFMKNVYSRLILSIPGKIISMVVFLGILAGGAYGLSQLRQDFDPDWFLPPDSMTIQYGKADTKYFPDGIQASVYVGEIDYFAEQHKLTALYLKIRSDKYVVADSAFSWYESYISWLQNTRNISRPRNETEFYDYLDLFFVSMDGARFRSDVKMNSTLKKIKASRISYSHIKLDGAKEEIAAMNSIQEIATSMNFNGFQAFGYTRFYIQWETNTVIGTELIRNLVLAGVVVLVVTLFLIADIFVSLMVLTCVVFTLIDIAGFMHFWGLTVDTVTTIQLILAIGLSVDYSAHIGHAFMASRNGNRNDRARNALIDIGPAVVHGGFSTFLAFVCLAGSKSYVFSTFFKLFFLVVVFGLFHGLVYLPVLLSLIGPGPYSSEDASSSKPEKETEMRTQPEVNGEVNAAAEDHREEKVDNPSTALPSADNPVYTGD